MAGKDEERQPLLRSRATSINEPVTSKEHNQKSKWNLLPQIQVIDSRYRFIPFIGALTVLVNEGEYYFKQIGYFRAIEALYCIEYFQVHDPDVAALGKSIPESMCKLDSIQKKVATANGIVMLVRMSSAFVGTMIVGYLADRLGRRFALIMHKIGTILYTLCVFVTYIGYPTVPIEVSFCGGLGGIIGANFDLNLAILLAAYNDVRTSPTQVATYFFITTSMQYVGQVAFPLAAGRAINLDGKGGTSEVSLLISLSMAVSGLFIAIFLFPETMRKGKVQDNERPEGEADTRTQGLLGMVSLKLRAYWANFQHSVRGIGTSNVFLLAISMFLLTTAIKAVDWLGLIQYPVIKFGWKYNQSTFAMAIQAVVYIFVYFALLPGYNKLGARYGISSGSTSLLIMLVSVTFLEAGAILLGLSFKPMYFIGATCLYTLGAGLPAVMQAYIANLVDKNALGRLLAIISLFQVGGKLAASALGPVIINAGIDSGKDNLKGAIFFFAAIVFARSASGIGLVAFRSRAGSKAAIDDSVEAI